MSSPVRVMVTVASCVLLLAACGSKSSSDNAVGGTSDASVTTATTNPYAVPANIDAAYVNRVLAAIEKVRGDVRREVFATHQFSETSSNKLADIYDGETLGVQKRVFSDASMSSDNSIIASPGDEVVTVQSIRASKSDCIAAEVMNDNSAVSSEGTSDKKWLYVLWLNPRDNNSNPTPWKIALVAEVGSPGSEYVC